VWQRGIKRGGPATGNLSRMRLERGRWNKVEALRARVEDLAILDVRHRFFSRRGGEATACFHADLARDRISTLGGSRTRLDIVVHSHSTTAGFRFRMLEGFRPVAGHRRQ